jgi:hypothetical protein
MKIMKVDIPHAPHSRFRHCIFIFVLLPGSKQDLNLPELGVKLRVRVRVRVRVTGVFHLDLYLKV